MTPLPAVCLLSLIILGGALEGKHRLMNREEMLKSVRNERIQFATQRPPGSRFALLERRVVVTGPPELVELVNTGDPRILPLLTELLKERSRAWAAEVLLASLTHREEKQVDSFAACPEKWWDAVGHGAHGRWSSWMSQVAGKLAWDESERMFVEKH